MMKLLWNIRCRGASVDMSHSNVSLDMGIGTFAKFSVMCADCNFLSSGSVSMAWKFTVGAECTDSTCIALASKRDRASATGFPHPTM